MKNVSISKWSVLVFLLCISLNANAQMPQTPQDILKMALGGLKFDFSGYYEGQPQQQQQQQQQPPQQQQQQRKTWHQCPTCHGTGRMEGHLVTSGGFFYCKECGKERPNGHYHTSCTTCSGQGGRYY
ncbi:MAG: hypothetical protein IJ844_06395 [Prevotella sp.]|nr:hypothetical protein [Prevotella sp.]